MSFGQRMRSFLGMSMPQRTRRLAVTLRWIRTRIAFAPFARACGAGSVLAPPTLVTPEYISLGENCFIGAGAKLLAGTVLGRQCIVGANAVARGHFDDYSVITGIPGRVVSAYRPEPGHRERVAP
jgi:acetyltransferase-like isoleucine patch superfamily enzyme